MMGEKGCSRKDVIMYFYRKWRVNGFLSSMSRAMIMRMIEHQVGESDEWNDVSAQAL